MKTIHKISFSTFLVIFLFSGCATTSPQRSEVELYNPSFDYNFPQGDTTNSEVTFAIISPKYGSRDGRDIRIFERFSSGLQADFKEMLTERGYSFIGPFESYNKMTYPQRKRADLALVPSVNFETETTNLGAQSNLPWSEVLSLGESQENYYFSGRDRVSGQITLSAIETLTGERMWYQNINLPSENVEWKAVEPLRAGEVNQLRAYEESRMSRYFLQKNDPGCVNPIAKQLESYYQEVLKESWKYLNPEEMEKLKSMADDLKQDYSPN